MHRVPQKVTFRDHIVDVNTVRLLHHCSRQDLPIIFKLRGIRELLSSERLAQHTSKKMY
jgi:hypothetical protein